MAHLFGIARIGRDAELRTTAQGDKVASLSLAFTYGRKIDGKRPTMWLDGALWGKQAEALTQYLLKGKQVGVTIEDVHIETFKKQDGTEASKMVGRVSSIEFVGAPAAATPAPPPAPRPPPPPPRPNSGFEDMDSDIPF